MAGGGPVYVQWGPVSITVANVVVLALMILVFIVAVWLRLPEHRGPAEAPSSRSVAEAGRRDGDG